MADIDRYPMQLDGSPSRLDYAQADGMYGVYAFQQSRQNYDLAREYGNVPLQSVPVAQAIPDMRNNFVHAELHKQGGTGLFSNLIGSGINKLLGDLFSGGGAAEGAAAAAEVAAPVAEIGALLL